MKPDILIDMIYKKINCNRTGNDRSVNFFYCFFKYHNHHRHPLQRGKRKGLFLGQTHGRKIIFSIGDKYNA